MATSIAKIQNGEQGLSVRTKLNNLIDLALRNEQNTGTNTAGLNEVMQKVVMLCSNGAKYKGIAMEDTDIDVSGDKVFYLAPLSAEPVRYRNFGLEIPPGVVALLVSEMDSHGNIIGFRAEIILTFDEEPRDSSINPVMSGGIKRAINGLALRENALTQSDRTESGLSLQSKVTQTSGTSKSSTIELPIATDKLAGLESAADKKKLNDIEEHATLGFQIIQNVETTDRIVAKRDVPLLLHIDNRLIKCVFDDAMNTIMVDPIGLAKIGEAIGSGSADVTAETDKVSVKTTLKSVDGKTSKEITFNIPTATSSKAGLLLPSEKNQISTNASDITKERDDRQTADLELQKMIEANVLYFELNENTGEVIATTGGESVYKSITMDEISGEITVEQEV